MRIIIGILFVLLGQVLLAQSPLRSTMISYQEDGQLFKTFIQNKKPEGTADKRLTYYYYHKNRIHHNQGGYAGYLLDGRLEVFNEEQRLIKQGQFKEGLKTGAWKEWHDNGKLKLLIHWKKGEQHGVLEEYNEQGQIVRQEHFKHNLRNGQSTYYSNGEPINKEYYKKGKTVRRKQSVKKAVQKRIKARKQSKKAKQDKKKATDKSKEEEQAPQQEQ